MKKYVILLICLIALTGCGKAEADERQKAAVFRASVIELTDTVILVEPEEGSAELLSADRIEVPNKDGLELQAGDIIEIEYDGNIMESYPAQLGEVYHITLAESAGSDDAAGEEAENTAQALTDQMVSVGMMDADMQTEDGRRTEWVTEEMKEVEIAGTVCYALDLRYSDDEAINGEMAGRLIGSYAVSEDGKEFYRYDAADDTWVEMLPDGE